MSQNDSAVEGSGSAESGRRKANIDEEKVVLVNELDELIGVENKTRAHLLGALHRAFSVFIINADGQLLLQKRAQTKYHSKGLWSNTCCGHPRLGETIKQASRRRLWEEMGIHSDLRKLFEFIYRANVDEGLIEHEYDHILIGWFDGIPQPDPDEVAEWKWADLKIVTVDLKAHPERYTYWFRISFDRFLQTVAAQQIDSDNGDRTYGVQL
jgi:isopentenyl-diphosphate Delta-isomerase